MILIEHATVLTLDPARRILTDGSILVDGRDIVQVGPSRTVRPPRLIGALMFAEFINITTMPADLKGFVTRFEVNPLVVVLAIAAIYVVLGTAMEELSMVLPTMPVFFPVIVHLGFDPVWFGIIIVCVVEIGLISPPVGMNMFVLKTLLPEVSTGTVFSGVLPFMWADVVRLAILITFPWLSLWLPSLMR